MFLTLCTYLALPRMDALCTHATMTPSMRRMYRRQRWVGTRIAQVCCQQGCQPEECYNSNSSYRKVGQPDERAHPPCIKCIQASIATVVRRKLRRVALHRR